MTSKELYESYNEKKIEFHDYINNIKKNAKWNLYTIINATLIKNLYISEFPKNYFKVNIVISSKILLFIKNSIKFYFKNIYLFFSYLVALNIYKIYYNKKRKNKIKVIFDIFGLVDNINHNEEFIENYLMNIYHIFDKCNQKYTILLRPYGVSKNPFKLIKFFKIINEDKRDFIFDYELLGLFDFIKLFGFIMAYPFKTLILLQNEKENIDKIFNQSLLNDISNLTIDGFTRYILGENLVKISSLEKIYSWSEFQVIERSFNYAIRKNNSKIELIGLQFYLNYETYFNAYVDDLDYNMLSSPHKVFVNGKYYVQNRQKVKYEKGVSLRYKEIFNFSGIKEETNILLLGSYIEKDTKYMLESVKNFDNVIFKNHPAANIKKFGQLPSNILISNKNIYKLFENTQLVIGTASGTSVEAVACGISVIIIASNDNLTANPLVSYGKGKIWDIAFSKDDVKILYNKLVECRKNNIDEIQKISMWYRDNFFIKPTEKKNNKNI